MRALNQVLVCVLTVLSLSARAVDWYPNGRTGATGTPLAVGAYIMDKTATPPSSAIWGAIPDAALADGASLTLTATLKLDPAPGTNSIGELRFGLLGAPRESGAMYQKSLRGFVLTGGMKEGRWVTQAWERLGETPFPCAFANKRVVASGKTDDSVESPTTCRIVLTVRRISARKVDLSGFYGPHTFNFTGLNLEQDLPDAFNCVAFLNGAASGVTKITIDNVRVTSP